MRLRDLPFAPYLQLVLLSGLEPAVIERLPSALAAAAPVRGGRRGSGRGDVPVERLADGMGLAALADHARRTAGRTPPGLPFGVTVSGSDVAISVPHRLMDGRGLTELVRSVLARATGTPFLPDTAPLVRRPTVEMVRRHLTWRLLRDQLAHRGSTPSAPGAAAAAHPAFTALVLDPGALARLETTEHRGTSVGMRAGSLALGALARVQRSQADLPVDMPIDLRRFVPRGRVLGNFVAVLPIGTLLRSDWSALGLGRRLLEEVRSKRPVARSVSRMLHAPLELPLLRLRDLARRPAAAAQPRVTLSLLGDPAGLPPEAWIPDAERLCGVAVTGPARPGPAFVLVWQLGDAVRISVWDESGGFDLDRYRDAVEEELAARRPRRAVA